LKHWYAIKATSKHWSIFLFHLHIYYVHYSHELTLLVYINKILTFFIFLNIFNNFMDFVFLVFIFHSFLLLMAKIQEYIATFIHFNVWNLVKFIFRILFDFFPYDHRYQFIILFIFSKYNIFTYISKLFLYSI